MPLGFAYLANQPIIASEASKVLGFKIYSVMSVVVTGKLHAYSGLLCCHVSLAGNPKDLFFMPHNVSFN